MTFQNGFIEKDVIEYCQYSIGNAREAFLESLNGGPKFVYRVSSIEAKELFNRQEPEHPCYKELQDFKNLMKDHGYELKMRTEVYAPQYTCIVLTAGKV